MTNHRARHRKGGGTNGRNIWMSAISPFEEAAAIARILRIGIAVPVDF